MKQENVSVKIRENTCNLENIFWDWILFPIKRGMSEVVSIEVIFKSSDKKTRPKKFEGKE